MEMAASPTARRRSEKGFPLFKTIVIIGIIGAVVIGGGALSFFADQASRQVPLQVELYPDALIWANLRNCPAHRCELYKLPGVSPEDVMAFYQLEMNQHYGSDVEQCVRIPETGQYELAELQPGQVPYMFKCHFDRSSLGTTQYTTVQIMPGMYNENPELNTEGMTVIRYDQVWQQ
jgi:hypothetical protein